MLFSNVMAWPTYCDTCDLFFDTESVSSINVIDTIYTKQSVQSSMTLHGLCTARDAFAGMLIAPPMGGVKLN